MSGPTTILERHSRVTPLGVCFWDDAVHAPVAQLTVEVYPAGDPQRRATARPNRIGTFVLPRLPGARDLDFEFGSGDPDFWASVATRPYVIEVTDPYGDYQPFFFEQRLPVRGLAVPPCLPVTSPPSAVIPLFPTASRRVPAGMTVVRAELRTASGAAAWAVLEVQVGAATPVRGVADRDGRVAVILPYPEPVASPARPSSPPYPSGASLHDQRWPVSLSVFFEPPSPIPAMPDLCRTVHQAPAFAWTDAASTRPLGDDELRYGHELVVGTVFVTPAVSPP